MTFCESLWTETAPIRAAINEHPFIRGLGDGTLPQETFVGYLAQDAAYLSQYARVLAGLATMAREPDEALFWANGARESIEVERRLHESHLGDMDAEELRSSTPLNQLGLTSELTGSRLNRMSPTNRAYTSYLLSLLVGGSYAEAAAGVLPCYWVYQDVGNSLLAVAGPLTDHPFGDWISLYSDVAFADQVAKAKGIVERLATDDVTRSRMTAAFTTATRYEWMFWDAAWRHESWPI